MRPFLLVHFNHQYIKNQYVWRRTPAASPIKRTLAFLLANNPLHTTPGI
jgi:hypothetical protein